MAGSYTEEVDPRSVRLALDANVLDPNAGDRYPLIRRFGDLWAASCLDVVVVEGVWSELRHPHAPTDLRLPLTALPTPRKAPSAAQHIVRIKVRAILRGDAAADKHAADAAHLCDASEAGCAYFLTQDRRFSKKRRDLEDALPSMRIIGLREFFSIYDRFASPRAEPAGGLDRAVPLMPRT